jgi:hypothetical protein
MNSRRGNIKRKKLMAYSVILAVLLVLLLFAIYFPTVTIKTTVTPAMVNSPAAIELYGLIRAGDSEAVERFLVTYPESANERMHFIGSMLVIAVVSNEPDIVRVLLESGAEPLPPGESEVDGNNAYELAVLTDDWNDCLRVLLESKAGSTLTRQELDHLLQVAATKNSDLAEQLIRQRVAERF